MNNSAQEQLRKATKDLYGSPVDDVSEEDGSSATAESSPEGGEDSKPEAPLLEIALETALDQVDPEDRSFYEQAQEQCPELVQRESSPARFFQACKRDYQRTAISLCRYWKGRVDLFGLEMAFKPLSFTGEGAIAQNSIENMKGGGYTILRADAHSRPVILVDQAFFAPSSQDATKTQAICLFYFLNFLVLRSEQALKNGIVLVFAMDTSQLIPPCISTAELFQNQVFPIKLRSMHLLLQQKTPFVSKIMASWLILFQKWDDIYGRYAVHHTVQDRDLIRSVSVYGLSKDHLPKRFGGSIDSASKFLNWMKDRIKDEEERDAPLSDTSIGEEADEESTKRRLALIEERKAKKRARDVQYQREKRAEEKELISNLQLQITRLSAANRRLGRKQAKLKEALSKVSLMAQEFDSQQQLTQRAHQQGQPLPGSITVHSSASSPQPQQPRQGQILQQNSSSSSQGQLLQQLRQLLGQGGSSASSGPIRQVPNSLESQLLHLLHSEEQQQQQQQQSHVPESETTQLRSFLYQQSQQVVPQLLQHSRAPQQAMPPAPPTASPQGIPVDLVERLLTGQSGSGPPAAGAGSPVGSLLPSLSTGAAAIPQPNLAPPQQANPNDIPGVLQQLMQGRGAQPLPAPMSTSANTFSGPQQQQVSLESVMQALVAQGQHRGGQQPHPSGPKQD